MCGCLLPPPLLPWSSPVADVRSHFCDGCMSRILWVEPPFCIHCGRPSKSNLPRRFCDRSRLVITGRSLAVYTGVVRTLLTDLKFRGVQAVAEPLGFLAGMVACEVAHGWRKTVVIPIPLHKERLAQRGFNQAELLGAGVARVLRRPMWTDVLVRTKLTAPQSSLSVKERRRNIEGAFAVTTPGLVTGRCFLLVDDVYTTGATIAAAAEALLLAGASEVRFTTVAVAVSVVDVLDWAGNR